MYKIVVSIIVCVMLSFGTVFAYDMKYIHMIQSLEKTNHMNLKDSKRSKYYISPSLWKGFDNKEKEMFVNMVLYYNLYLGNEAAVTIHYMSNNKMVAMGAADGIKIYQFKD